jgi:DNA-binding GntR family transcriptional regulator
MAGDATIVAALATSLDGNARYRSLADNLRLAIVSGRLAPGTRLPSERALAETIAVSRTTVVSAYNLLRADSLLETMDRRGTWVAEVAR